MFPGRPATGPSQPRGPPPRGECLIAARCELALLDERAARQVDSYPDAEIVDRALAVQTLARRPVTMVTYDISMALRARYAGLKVVSPPYPEHEEQPRSSRGHGIAGTVRTTGNGAGR